MKKSMKESVTKISEKNRWTICENWQKNHVKIGGQIHNEIGDKKERNVNRERGLWAHLNDGAEPTAC